MRKIQDDHVEDYTVGDLVVIRLFFQYWSCAQYTASNMKFLYGTSV